ncbi:MAG: Unknown protein [uncultured Sulfurovum sp.]|uniref:Uncharacterized protein n=1 Tax=uncultured Sulfurovum sp. TaxID=269237 RepID=A0A6S6S181_9BACT|nr:MAG: Unknown protein [uncultured Sulfurovum sp.]
MKIILTLSFFLLLLISCSNEKEKTYPITSIHTYIDDNIEKKTINSAYKDSSTLIMSRTHTLTNEMSSYLFSRTYFDSVRTTYSKTTIWSAQRPNDKGDYYYSERTSIDYTTRNSSKTITNDVTFYSKNEIPYQKWTELMVWPMNQLTFISTKMDSVITGSYSSDSISYQYKIQNRRNRWSIRKEEDAFMILKNTNDTIFMSLISSSSSRE